MYDKMVRISRVEIQKMVGKTIITWSLKRVKRRNGVSI